MDKNKILGFGEIMLRLTPPNNEKILQATSFEAEYGGGEANVIASLSILGHNTKFATKLPNNYLGDKVINKFRGYNVDLSSVIFGEGRLGVYYAEIGHGLRATDVIYDRKYSAISMAKEEEFDIENMLQDVKLVHLSGITPALSKDLANLILKIVKYCKENNIKVSYDSNYRAKLWSLEEAKSVLEEVLNYTDYAFLGYLDMINILNFEEDKNIDFKQNLANLYAKLFEKYPNLKYAASTKRTVNSINNNSLEGFLFDGKKLYNSNVYTFDIIDRIGGGDSFTAGILHGILKEMDNQNIIEFGICASALKHSIKGDINILDEATINNLLKSGLSSVKR